MRQLSSVVGKLAEAVEGHTQTMNDLVTRVERLEGRMNTLEDAAAGEGLGTKKNAASKGGSNDHPSLKVSQLMKL
jgi:hypothetical protein